MKELTGGEKMDASAVLEYFAPLQTWLKQQNEGQTCGWQASGHDRRGAGEARRGSAQAGLIRAQRLDVAKAGASRPSSLPRRIARYSRA